MPLDFQSLTRQGEYSDLPNWLLLRTVQVKNDLTTDNLINILRSEHLR